MISSFILMTDDFYCINLGTGEVFGIFIISYFGIKFISTSFIY